MEADKIKKKLNGSILKGSKMSVEEARPKKATKAGNDDDAPNTTATSNKASRKKISIKQEEGVIPGYELPAERKVKRGWTEPISTDKKSSYRRKDKTELTKKKSIPKTLSITGEAECLFKTKIPANATSASDTAPSREGKAKKRKRAESNRDVVVHEFSNTTKHASFLRDDPRPASQRSTSEYVEGKGWVDEDGNMVEEVPKKRRVKTQQREILEDGSAESMPHRSRRSSRLEAPSLQVTAPIANIEDPNDETSPSGTSSESESDGPAPQVSPPFSKEAIAPGRKPKTRSVASKSLGNDVEVDRVERLSITRSSATPSPIGSSQPISAPATSEVHPLEALFKRPTSAPSHTPKKPNLEVSTSFNFFDSGAEEEGSQGLLMPQTPFTQHDIRQRRQRSAAPTPDTAAPGKTFGEFFATTSDVSDSEEDDEGKIATPADTKAASTDSREEKPESEFSKWFWEHRGENNRAWKRRRREAAKEKRQLENKERKA